MTDRILSAVVSLRRAAWDRSGLFLFLALILGAAHSGCAAPEPRTFPGAEWEHRDPGALGLDGQALEDLAEMLGGRGCVVRHGYVAKSWGDQAERGDWLSSAKPVLSTLLFFAIQEGLATGVDQPIVEFGWDLRPRDRGMTFRHLGAMSSGYTRPEGPGEAWAYNDYAIMLYQKTLFDRVFKGDAEAIANDPARLGALGLQDGLRFSSKRRLIASARDFARIAWLWLNRGRWGDRELLDRRFFDDYMKPQTPKDLPHTAKADTDDYLGIGSFGGGSDHFTEYGAGIYGMNWWFNRTGRLHPERRTWPDGPRDTIMSIGAGGNSSVVIPSLDLVLVCARGDWGALDGGDSSAKMNRIIRRLAEAVTGEGALPAFPGAEGFGAFTPVGRGGKVFLVTTLADYHPANEAAIQGSLRQAVAAEGPRIIVFRVGGNIMLKTALAVTSPYVTIAGQTAPGGGVCLTTYPLIIGTHDVIVRHLRVRLGDESKAELGTLDIFGGQNVIVDHCTVSWAIDECFSVTGSETKNVTVQWCIIGGGLNRSFHPKGEHGHDVPPQRLRPQLQPQPAPGELPGRPGAAAGLPQ